MEWNLFSVWTHRAAWGRTSGSLLSETSTKREVTVSLLLNSSLKMICSKNAGRSVYDTLHLTSHTQHRCWRNTEWLPCLIISALVETHMHLCPCFFVLCVWWELQSQQGHSGQAAASAGPFGASPSTKRHSRCAWQAATTCCPPTSPSPSAPHSLVPYQWGSSC